MTNDSSSVLSRIAECLWSDELAEREKLKRDNNLAFAYYTSAETAFKIINSGSIYMRDTRLMNDSSEINYANWLLDQAITNNEVVKHVMGEQIASAHPDLAQLLASDYGMLRMLSNRTYVTSLSRHNLERDFLGRLSMWRGYGTTNGVALIVSSAPFQDQGNNWGGIISSPVSYLWPDVAIQRVTASFEKLAELNIDWASLEPHSIRILLSNYFATFCINTKHPGFSEEREWRLHCRPDEFSSPWVKERIEIIGGIPQAILELKIAGPLGELSQVLIGAIVGPSAQQNVIRDTLVKCFQKAGFKSPDTVVHTSPTPWISA